MKTLMTASLALLVLATPAPMAMADDTDDGAHRGPGAESAYTLSRENAAGIARAEGMARIDEVERDDGKWELEGCTREGHEIEIDIHGRTGDILKLEIDRDNDDDDC